MSIYERIFHRLDELKMSQKEFAEKTEISQSAISGWKSRKTNPTSDKIMIICQVLKVSPEWLLSGAEKEGKRGHDPDFLVVDKQTELGKILTDYNSLPHSFRERTIGYMKALKEMIDLNEDEK